MLLWKSTTYYKPAIIRKKTCHKSLSIKNKPPNVIKYTITCGKLIAESL